MIDSNVTQRNYLPVSKFAAISISGADGERPLTLSDIGTVLERQDDRLGQRQ